MVIKFGLAQISRAGTALGEKRIIHFSSGGFFYVTRDFEKLQWL